MIKYALVCEHDHAFEGWFAASADYEDQMAAGRVECPVCGASDVRKQIMAPAVAGTKARSGAAQAPAPMREMMMEAMGKVRQLVEDNFDYVGDAFATEARAIHEGRSEDRGIYGEASPKEVRALVEDGVNVAPMPPAPPKKSELN
jgi:hypothetical protein